MSPLIYEPESTTHTGKSTVSYYIFTSNQTNCHLSPSKFLPWLVKEYLIFHVIKLPHADKAAPDYNNALKNSGFNENIKLTPRPPKRANAAETFYGLIGRSAPTWRPILAKYFCNSLISTSQNTINITSCLIGIMLKLVIVVCRTW